VPAAPEVVETVHRPIQQRAFESPHRQPCDSTGWQYNQWIAGALDVSESLRGDWLSWLAGPESVALEPSVAVAGFPLELEAWTWYLDNGPHGGVNSSDDEWRAQWPKGGVPFSIGEPIDGASVAQQRATSEANRRFLEESQRRMVAADKRTVVHARPFRGPIGGKGKWHTSYADVEGSPVPPWVTDPERVPACGSRTVELDPSSEAFYPELGDKRSKYTSRLCGNCIRIE